MKTANARRYLVASTFLSLLSILISSSGLVYATTKSSNSTSSSNSSSNNSSPIVQSFNAGAGVYPGMFVAMDSKNAGSVIALTGTDEEKMIGAVVPVNNAQISLTPSSSGSQQVLVAESGRYDVLVSTEGGDISSGENLTISSLAGVAMKASPSNQTSVGQAESNFNGKSGVISEVKLKGSNGISQTYAIGSILVNVHLSQNTQYIPTSSGLPQFVIQAAYSIAKKPVNPARIYLGFIIIFAIILVVSTMFYSGTKNGIISIGRNPLSKKSIAKGLTQTIVAGLFVFGIGVGLVYLIIAV